MAGVSSIDGKWVICLATACSVVTTLGIAGTLATPYGAVVQLYSVAPSKPQTPIVAVVSANRLQQAQASIGARMPIPGTTIQGTTSFPSVPGTSTLKAHPARSQPKQQTLTSASEISTSPTPLRTLLSAGLFATLVTLFWFYIWTALFGKWLQSRKQPINEKSALIASAFDNSSVHVDLAALTVHQPRLSIMAIMGEKKPQRVIQVNGLVAKAPAMLDPSSCIEEANILLTLLPVRIKDAIDSLNSLDCLVEIILDYGRRPVARFPEHSQVLDVDTVTRRDLDHVVGQLGDFTSENRAGLEGTLHRVSALRNRKSEIIGLTCRIGRAAPSNMHMIMDMLASGKSLLLLGKPGSGKTTVLREISRSLADDFGKRVVVIDTSNEIAGEGDVPHPGIGSARRMQVMDPDYQHECMIEAVQNHTPEVIIVDEIGSAKECLAARTIAERGVQLIATAHGKRLKNVLQNPNLVDCVGGIESVTLGDEEARRRGSQKVCLQRSHPPTFGVCVEMASRQEWNVYVDTAAAIDDLLRYGNTQCQRRITDATGKVDVFDVDASDDPREVAEAKAAKALDRRNSTWRNQDLMPSPYSGVEIDPLPIQGSVKDLASKLMGVVNEEPDEYEKEPQRKRKSNAALFRSPSPSDDLKFGTSLEFSHNFDQVLAKRCGGGVYVVYPYGLDRHEMVEICSRSGLPFVISEDVVLADLIVAYVTRPSRESKLHRMMEDYQVAAVKVACNSQLDIYDAMLKLRESLPVTG